jgi:hypothetical protein
MDTLKAYIKSTDCPEMFFQERKNEAIFRCKKSDADRGKFYDNYWFRVSAAGLIIDEEHLPEIEHHTICIDEFIRIEAYPPE